MVNNGIRRVFTMAAITYVQRCWQLGSELVTSGWRCKFLIRLMLCDEGVVGRGTVAGRHFMHATNSFGGEIRPFDVKALEWHNA